jgi:hypothetical protein
MYLHFEKIPQNDGRKPTICFNKTPDSVPRQVMQEARLFAEERSAGAVDAVPHRERVAGHNA